MTTVAQPRSELWRWFVLLLIANELDLAYTYLGLSGGAFREANPLMAPLLATFWPIAMKLIPLAGLALGIVAVTTGAHHLEQPTLRGLRLATAIYTVILVLHVLNIVPSFTIKVGGHTVIGKATFSSPSK